jgi:8-oxo-dGTP diphosphatase
VTTATCASTPIDAVVAIICQQQRYLFVRRAAHLDAGAGHWSPVSGRVEVGETEADAVEREVMEEVGLDVTAERKLCTLETPDGRFRLHFWIARVRAGTARPRTDEVSALRWVALGELDTLEPRFDDDLDIIRAHAAGID